MMSTSRVVPAIRNSLIGSSLYRPVRFVYQALFNRVEISRRRARKRLYSQFIHPGDLVFDVGANVGNFCETFLSLGARVVAVEPDPRSLAFLRRRFAGRAVVEPCALGSAEGSAVLHMSSYTPGSSLSEEWVGASKWDWRETTPVAVSTLEALKAKHGTPQHVKIDCEGFDYEVLCGMSFVPNSLSFEFNRIRLIVARSCLERLRGWKFNYTILEGSAFQIDHWIDSDDMWTRLSCLPTDLDYGNVYSLPR